MTSINHPLHIGVVLFPGFELLDTFGPLEFFLLKPNLFTCTLLGQSSDPVPSSQGPRSVIDLPLQQCEQVDILFIPGGKGTRAEVDNPELLQHISRLSQTAKHTATVCTGAALLSRTGLLDGHRATTNKAAWDWATAQGPNVNWIPQARWVEDGKYFTSSGISAGMDMALALIQKLYGPDLRAVIANQAEYEWNPDSSYDPFAKINNLI